MSRSRKLRRQPRPLSLKAAAYGEAIVNQAGRDQHLHFEPGVRRVVSAAGEPDSGCPYPGLATFTADEVGWFFGRDRLIAELLIRLDECQERGRPLVLVAPSGAGKSSLLRAGLLGRVADGALSAAGSRHWPRIVFTPSESPMREAALALKAVEPGAGNGVALPEYPTPDDLDELLRRAAEAAGERLGRRARVVIVVDQLEELFGLCESEDERDTFVSWLCRASGSEPSREALALVACGLRADFYDECARHPILCAALQASQVLVGAMSPDELRQVITCPAKAAGLDVEPGLVEILLSDLRAGKHAAASTRYDATADYDAGRLPLLAHALRATWQLRHGRTLTVAAYLATGGIEHSVADTAERVFGGLDASGQRHARVLFLRLVKIGASSSEDVRRPVSRDRLTGGSPVMEAVVKACTASRLFTPARDAIQITHEALLSAWPRLRDWLDDDRPGNLTRQDIEEAAAGWAEAGSDRALLLRGARLETASGWAKDPGHDLSENASRFVASSLQLRRRTTIIRRAAVAALAVLTAIACVTSVIALQQRATALRESNLAISNLLAAGASQISATSTSGAAQLLLAAYREHPSAALAARLLGTESQPLAVQLPPLNGGAVSVAFSPDGRIMASGSATGAVTMWAASQSQPPRRISQATGGGAVPTVAFSPNGQVLASSGVNGTVTLWGVSRSAHLRKLSRPVHFRGQPGCTSAFRPDSRVLVTACSARRVPSGSYRSAVTVWDIADPAHPRELGHPIAVAGGSLNSIAISPDGRTLAAGLGSPEPFSNGGRIILWDIANPAMPRRLGRPVPASGPVVYSVAFSPDGHILASADDYDISPGNNADSSIDLWNVTNPARPIRLGQPVATGETQTYSVAFSPDGRTIVTAGSTYSAPTDTSDDIEMWNIAQPASPTPVSVSPVSGSDGVTSAIFSPDGHDLAAVNLDGTISLWNLPPTVVTSTGSPVSALKFSPNGAILAGGSGQSYNRAYSGQVIDLWDVTDPVYPRAFVEPVSSNSGPSVQSMAFGADGRILESDDWNQITLWDMTRPARARERRAIPLSSILYSAISPDGRLIANGDFDHQVGIWKITSPVRTTRRDPLLRISTKGSIKQLALSPDDRTAAIVTSAPDGNSILSFWDISGSSHARELGHLTTRAQINDLSFSPNGILLASGNDNGTISLWSVANPASPRQLTRPLRTNSEGGDASFAPEVAISPDGHLLASGNGNGTISLWSITNPQRPEPLWRPLQASTSPIDSVTFNPHGNILATGSDNGIVQLWNLNFNFAIKRICATTTISSAQWQQYVPQAPYAPACQR